MHVETKPETSPNPDSRDGGGLEPVSSSRWAAGLVLCQIREMDYSRDRK